MVLRLKNIREETLQKMISQLESVKQSGHKGRILKQGIIGEGLVHDYLYVEYDGDVQMTDDWFDSEKDGIVAGQTYEVKTVFPYVNENLFSIISTQEAKIRNVDRLFIVEVPASDSALITIHELPREHRQYFTIREVEGTLNFDFEFTLLEPRCIINNKAIANTLCSFHPTARRWLKYGHFHA